jgi:hypothetical protein
MEVKDGGRRSVVNITRAGDDELKPWKDPTYFANHRRCL